MKKKKLTQKFFDDAFRKRNKDNPVYRFAEVYKLSKKKFLKLVGLEEYAD